MFAKKVQATIWNDELAKKSNRSCGYQARDPRRNFVATYIFDDGFKDGKEQCLEYLRHCGFRERDFLLVRFAGQWYAVNFQSYGSHLLVTAEGFLYQSMAFQTTERIGEEEARTLRIDPAWPDNKMWQDGIMQDLLLLDKNLYIESNGKPVPADSILFNNAAIISGIPFFIILPGIHPPASESGGMNPRQIYGIIYIYIYISTNCFWRRRWSSIRHTDTASTLLSNRNSSSCGTWGAAVMLTTRRFRGVRLHTPLTARRSRTLTQPTVSRG